MTRTANRGCAARMENYFQGSRERTPFLIPVSQLSTHSFSVQIAHREFLREFALRRRQLPNNPSVVDIAHAWLSSENPLHVRQSKVNRVSKCVSVLHMTHLASVTL